MEGFEEYVRAGRIARKVVSFARGLCVRGAKLIDIAEAIDAKILELGGDIAFPVNLSLNEIAAHFTPEPGCEIVAEGILKVDIGVAVDGYIADTAFSVDLSETGEFGEMIELNEKILGEIGKVVVPGVEVCDVGNCVSRVLKESGKKEYSVIRNLCGHSLGQNTIHAGLTISNYANENSRKLEGAFAIEPFVTTGAGEIYEGEVGGIYVLQSEENVRDRDARKVLEFIREEFEGRPFCLRFLVSEFGEMSLVRLRMILKGMVRQGILHEYPMLIEKGRKPVSQAENTFLVLGDEVFCTTCDK